MGTFEQWASGVHQENNARLERKYTKRALKKGMNAADAAAYGKARIAAEKLSGRGALEAGTHAAAKGNTVVARAAQDAAGKKLLIRAGKYGVVAAGVGGAAYLAGKRKGAQQENQRNESNDSWEKAAKKVK